MAVFAIRSEGVTKEFESGWPGFKDGQDEAGILSILKSCKSWFNTTTGVIPAGARQPLVGMTSC